MCSLKEKIIWLAGLFEGEGTTGLYKYKRGKNEVGAGKWRITTYWLICNNDPAIINEVDKIMNELGVSHYIFQRPGEKEEHRLNYQICCKNFKGVYRMLEMTLPYLRGLKKDIAEMTMRFIKKRNFGIREKGKRVNPYDKEDFELYEKVHSLNQRGKNKQVESSETIRQALVELTKKTTGEDMVQTSMKIGEEIK